MPFAIPLAFAGSAAFGTAAGASTAAIMTDLAIAAISGGAVMQTKAQKEQGETEQAWHEYNAAISQQTAAAEREAAIHEEKQFRKEGVRHKARMRALYGKAELGISEGTPFLTLEETAGEIEKDALMIRRGGIIKEQKAISQAGLDIRKGRFARRAGRHRAYATLLSGGGRMANIYGRHKGYW